MAYTQKEYEVINAIYYGQIDKAFELLEEYKGQDGINELFILKEAIHFEKYNFIVKLVEKKGLDINTEDSCILRTAINRSSTKLITLLRKYDEQLIYPKDFHYDLSLEAKYKEIKKTKGLLNLKSYDIQKANIPEMIYVIYDRWAKKPDILTWIKFLIKKCPAEQLKDLPFVQISEYANKYEGAETIMPLVFKEIIKKKQLESVFNSNYKYYQGRLRSVISSLPLKESYKLVQKKILSQKDYEYFLKEEYQIAMQEKGINLISDEINNILKKDINSLTFDEESKILSTVEIKT